VAAFLPQRPRPPHHMDRTDRQLLSDWKNGESGAFTVLVRRYQDALLRHARGLLGRGSSYEDVVQEVFLKLAREPLELIGAQHVRDRTEHGQSLAAWLHTVTRNACMDTIRTDQRRKTREAAVAAPEATGGGQQTVDAQDTRNRVEAAITGLPIDQREVLILRLLAGRSYREIAEVTGRKVGTVGWLISEGLRSLNGTLSPLMEAEQSSGNGMGIA
jgi:RNA polymerase sigma-70 factor (ECF subfamily)